MIQNDFYVLGGWKHWFQHWFQRYLIGEEHSPWSQHILLHPFMQSVQLNKNWKKLELIYFQWSPLASYFNILSGIHSGILFGIYSDILSVTCSDSLPGILSGIYSDILSVTCSDSLPGILSGIYSDILPVTCSDSLPGTIWHLFWHSTCHMFWQSAWHSICIYSDILPVTCSDSLPGTLSGIYSDILPVICSDSLPGILYASILTFYLTCSAAFSFACVRALAWPTASGDGDMVFRSRRGPLHPKIATWLGGEGGRGRTRRTRGGRRGRRRSCTFVKI